MRPGEEDLHATDVGGMSNASVIGEAGCAVAARAACDALLIQLELEEDVPRHGLSLPAFRRDRNLGLGRSWPVAFGRTKNISRARPAHRARDAARAPRGRRTVPTKMVFEAPAPQDWRPLVRAGASTG